MPSEIPSRISYPILPLKQPIVTQNEETAAELKKYFGISAFSDPNSEGEDRKKLGETAGFSAMSSSIELKDQNIQTEVEIKAKKQLEIITKPPLISPILNPQRRIIKTKSFIGKRILTPIMGPKEHIFEQNREEEDSNSPETPMFVQTALPFENFMI